MKQLFMGLLLSALVLGCGPQREVVQVHRGEDGISMGLYLSPLAPSPSCLAGGATLTTFVDANRNSEFDSGEPVKKIQTICNGINGTNGQDGVDGTSVTIEAATASDCPAGGYLINGQPLCNGENGSLAGVTPVQLCPGDTGNFKEYGLVIGQQLFAVYYGPIGGSQQAFLALLKPGSYITTNGAACTFTYNANGTITNSHGTTVLWSTTPPLTLGVPGITSKTCSAVTNGHCACTVSNGDRLQRCMELLGISDQNHPLVAACQAQYGGSNPNEAGYQCSSACTNELNASCVNL